MKDRDMLDKRAPCYFKTVFAGVLALLLATGQPGLAQEDTETSEAIRDPKAMEILRQMSDYLGSAGTFSVKMATFSDHVRDSGIKIKSSAERQVFVRRPSEFHARVQFDDQTSREVWYDGNTLIRLDRPKKEYMKLAFSGSIDELLDHVIDNYEVQLPLADFLYSDIVGTFGGNIISAEYVGERLVRGVLCHQLSIESTGADWQIWVEADDTPVPCRFAIVYVNVPGEPEYLAIFDEWKINPNLDEALFKFKTPNDAKEVQSD